MEALRPITKPECRTAPSVSPPSCETTRCGTRKPRVDARSRRTQRKELSRRETRADPPRERDLMAPAKKSGTRASARVRKPPPVDDFVYDDESCRQLAGRRGSEAYSPPVGWSKIALSLASIERAERRQWRQYCLTQRQRAQHDERQLAQEQ